MGKLTPFDFLNSINQSKVNLIEDELSERDYNPFMVNRGLSYFKDTVFPANEMNLAYGLDKGLQYAYLLNIIAPRKRFSKWFKADNSDDLELVKAYYGYNNQRAKQVLDILTPEQIITIKEKLFKGGTLK